MPKRMNNNPIPTKNQKIPPTKNSSAEVHHVGQTNNANTIGTITKIKPPNNSSHLFIFIF